MQISPARFWWDKLKTNQANHFHQSDYTDSHWPPSPTAPPLSPLSPPHPSQPPPPSMQKSRPAPPLEAGLELEDSTTFRGRSFGAEGKSVSGKCVFQTGKS
ncbi:hypothetical protein M422DRAFT_242523 [Sphaerobolus stellatus SS14]|nr:hypothetical protein M422DRAFT_242523 [Sphaerobolus stellatus SS14]